MVRQGFLGSGMDYRLSILISAVWWLLFSIPVSRNSPAAALTCVSSNAYMAHSCIIVCRRFCSCGPELALRSLRANAAAKARYSNVNMRTIAPSHTGKSDMCLAPACEQIVHSDSACLSACTSSFDAARSHPDTNNMCCSYEYS